MNPPATPDGFRMLNARRQSNDAQSCAALCPAGLEPLVADELRTFGAAVTETRTSTVLFTAPLEAVYRACIWSRYANRVLLPLATFTAHTGDDLYAGSRAVAWDDHFGADNTFAVRCTGHDAAIPHSRYAMLRVKDGIVDYFRDHYGRRPSVRNIRPDITVHVYSEGAITTLSLDLSGESLHVRGYRAEGAEAPLKETLAAGVVRLTGWPDGASAQSVFLDPLCGSGTLLIEAAMLYGGMPPGIGRRFYCFLQWRRHDRRVWDAIVAEAAARRDEALRSAWPAIIGYDASPDAVRAARRNIARAGLEKIIRVEHRELCDFTCPDGVSSEARRFIVTNPPYGERLEGNGAVKYLYRCIGRVVKENCAGWRAGVFTSSVELADALGMEPREKHRLYNGQIPCRLYVYEVSGRPPVKAGPVLTVTKCRADGPAADFANRLQKNVQRILPWARRGGVSCFRVYDADMPEYNMAIDIYEQWIHVQEYAPPQTVDPVKAERRFREALMVIRETFAAGRDRIFIKRRQRQRGKGQYQKKEAGGRLHEVREGACRFLINLTDYLDTGLFLDHRSTRAMIGAAAGGKRFLNLFGYTGTATVHAALGGARTTVTVDRSPVYCAWAQSNFALNGLGGGRTAVVRADCMQWLSQCRETFDVVFADPPTFSNRKGTPDVFDVQRDHVALIRAAAAVLAPGGVLIFSTNYRKFRLDLQALHEMSVHEITAQTIPFDFTRNPRVHQCWEIRT